MTMQGNVGAQVYLTRNGVTSGGPGISNGISGAGSVSVTAFAAFDLANLVAETSFVLSASAYASSAMVTANSGNVHLTAVANFYR